MQQRQHPLSLAALPSAHAHSAQQQTGRGFAHLQVAGGCIEHLTK